MKLESNTGEMSLENSEIIEELEEELNQLREEKKHWENFWKKVENIYKHGIPASDKKGHREKISFNVVPAHKDMIEQMRDVVPTLIFKSSSELHRLAHLVGIECILLLAKTRGGKVKRYQNLWEKIKKVYLFERISQTENFVDEMEKRYISDNNVIDPKVIQELRETKDEITKELTDIVRL